MNPGTPVVMKWDAGKGWYEGDGNGMTYRVVKEDDGWKVRAICRRATSPWCGSCAARSASVPLRWGGYVPTGPLWRAYGITSDFDDSRLEIELLNP
jgi:hypothetical protein